MAIRDLLRAFVANATVIDKTFATGGLVLFQADPNVYGPGVGARAGAGVYVDTGQYQCSQGGRLWTDRASWCMIMASYDSSAGRCYLAHLSPGQLPVGPGIALKAYSASPPPNLTLFTMPAHLATALATEQGAKDSSFWSVYGALDLAYPLAGGAAAMAHKTRIITGFAGVEWDVSFGVAVEPFGVFPMTSQPSNEAWVSLFHPQNA